MFITNNYEDIRSLPEEQSNFLHAIVHQVKIYSFSKAYESTRGMLQIFSCYYGLLREGQAHIACNKLARIGITRSSQHEEEFEMMQGLINGLERILVAEAWKDWKYDLGIRDVETEEFGVIKEGVN